MNPIEKKKKRLLDFFYVLPVGTGRDLSVHENRESIKSKNNSPALNSSVQEWINDNNFKSSQIGLSKLSHIKDMFVMYYDASAVLGYRGIVKNELSNEVSLSSIPKGEQKIAYLYCNLEGYSKYCKEYAEYWDWIDKRNEERYNTNQQHGKNYDSKNMMHTIRLLQSAEQILATGTLNIRVSNRDELLAIKAGEMEYDALLQKADDLIASIEHLYTTSTLPEVPDSEKLLGVLVGMREELYMEK